MRRLLLVLAVVIVAIAGFVFFRNRGKSSASPPKPAAAQSAQWPEDIPSQQKLTIDIVRQGITPERAKLLFSMAVGPLPGVKVPVEARDPSDFDGTMAIGYLYHFWNTLTPEQRAAAADLIRPLERTRQRQSRKKRPFFELPRVLPAAFVFSANLPAYDYQSIADTANGMIAAALGVPTITYTITVDYDPPSGTEYAHTWSWFRSKENPDAPDEPYPTGCNITVWNDRFQTLDLLGAESVLTHEMFHCFQEGIEGSADARWSLHPWIVEGEATWVMCDLVPGANIPVLTTRWGMYTSAPGVVYSDRSYDAVGVYGHLSDMAGPEEVWPKLLPMIGVGLNGNDLAALGLLLQGNQADYYTTWGSSYFRVTNNIPWTIFGPGAPPNNSPAPQMISVDSQTMELLSPAAPYLGEQFQLQGNPDLLGVMLFTGYGRAHDANFGVDTPLVVSAPLILCLKQGGCRCPDGSPGASMVAKNATAPISIGINGGDTTAQVGVAGHSLDDFCKKPDPDQPPPPPPGGGGGSSGGGGGGGDNPDQPRQPPPPDGRSYGDVHMATFDGLGYDFQVVGEYTLARSTKDDFAVQVRQVPVLGIKIASVDQAVAARVGDHRVTFTMENADTVVRFDGKIVSGALPKLKGGSLTRASTAYGGAFQLTWADGTVLSVQQIGSTAMNVKVNPSASRRGTLAGLLGDFDGSEENDLIGKNGAKLGVNFTKDDINHSLADTWRVTQSTSLFDYAAGQSSASFNDPNFPAKDANAAGLANYATAEQTCRAHGITDQRLLDDCILDLAATGSFIFGSQYAHAQQVLAARAALAHPAAPPSLPTIWMTGEILDSQSEPEFHFDGKKGDVIWIHDPDCVDNSGQHPVFLRLFDPSGKSVEPFGMGCQFGRRELPATGKYTFKAVFKYRNENTKYKIPIRFTRPDRHQQISYGQMVSGNIETRAAHDVYTFQAQEGDLIVFSGQGCELGGLAVSVYDAQGHDFLAPSCRTGTVFRMPKTGTYSLVINSDQASEPGPYHFVFQGGKIAK
jgi:von Willebrand factor type D domain